MAATRSKAAERSAVWSKDRQVRIVLGCFAALRDSAPKTATMQLAAFTLAPLTIRRSHRLFWHHCGETQRRHHWSLRLRCDVLRLRNDSDAQRVDCSAVARSIARRAVSPHDARTESTPINLRGGRKFSG
jgi:hypothetical protein